MTESQQLLAEYAAHGSEAAFRELVARYINLVYSTALRLVNGDTHLAEDVTQTVFIHLSRNARRLGPGVTLGGWLHRNACYAAGKAMRRERRRQTRERHAVLMQSLQDHTEANLEKIAPVLDETVNAVGHSSISCVVGDWSRRATVGRSPRCYSSIWVASERIRGRGANVKPRGGVCS